MMELHDNGRARHTTSSWTDNGLLQGFGGSGRRPLLRLLNMLDATGPVDRASLGLELLPFFHPGAFLQNQATDKDADAFGTVDHLPHRLLRLGAQGEAGAPAAASAALLSHTCLLWCRAQKKAALHTELPPHISILVDISIHEPV
jgi:hypothetical protein